MGHFFDACELDQNVKPCYRRICIDETNRVDVDKKKKGKGVYPPTPLHTPFEDVIPG